MLVNGTGIPETEDVMNKSIGTSLLLAAIVAVGLGTSARANEFNGTEEDLAVPVGSYNSAIVYTFNAGNGSLIVKAQSDDRQPILKPTATEEDLAVPAGSYNSAWVYPTARKQDVRVADNASRNNAVAGVE
jgi:hypothetical protein